MSAVVWICCAYFGNAATPRRRYTPMCVNVPHYLAGLPATGDKTGSFINVWSHLIDAHALTLCTFVYIVVFL